MSTVDQSFNPSDQLRTMWPVPKLTVLAPGELVAVLHHHFKTCGEDHRSMAFAAPDISAIDFAEECFVCNRCGQIERFDLFARWATSADAYICRLLKQGVQFNRTHFESCFTAKGDPQ